MPQQRPWKPLEEHPLMHRLHTEATVWLIHGGAYLNLQTQTAEGFGLGPRHYYLIVLFRKHTPLCCVWPGNTPSCHSKSHPAKQTSAPASCGAAIQIPGTGSNLCGLPAACRHRRLHSLHKGKTWVPPAGRLPWILGPTRLLTPFNSKLCLYRLLSFTLCRR